MSNCVVYAGADPGFFSGGGALVSCSTSTPINHIVFFLQNTSCIRKPQVISGGGGGLCTPCTLPLDSPLLWSPLMTSWGCHAMLRIGEEHALWTTLLMAAKRTSLIRIILNTVSMKLQDFK